MKIRVWRPEMTAEETKDVAYWERNMLALHFAEGWYNDDVIHERGGDPKNGEMRPRYDGWRRVLSLEEGKLTFHIPDDFEVGDLPEIKPNWDGHTTPEKWRTVMLDAGVEETP